MSPYPQRETSAQLVEALIDAVAHVEPLALSAVGVAARAGLPADAVERSWGSLEELLGAAYSRAARALNEAMAEALRGSGSWLSRWEAAVCAAVSLMRRRPGIARLVFIESESGPPSIRQRRDLHRRDFVELFASAYARDGQVANLPDLHVELAAGAAYRAFHEEAAAGRLTSGCAEAAPRLVDAMAIFQPLAAA